MSDEHIVHNLRNMAWERAKGELRSMQHTFWSGRVGNCSEHQYANFTEELEKFIKTVESNGLHE